MATFKHHLNDLKWLFYERGMQHVYNWLVQFANATTQGTTPTGAGAIGLLEVDASGANGLTAALTNTINPSGQLNLVTSTAVEYGAGAVPKTVPTLTR